MSPISRRVFLVRSGAVALAASSSAVLAACATSTTSPSASAASAPAGAPTPAVSSAAPSASAAAPTGQLADTQKLVLGVQDLPPTLDYMAATHNTPRFYDLYEPLINLDPNANLKPFLALSWNSVDDTTYELKLRQGVKFHNGQDFTPDDVKFSFERITRTDKPLPGASIIDTFKAVEIVDPQTVRISSKTPDALFPKKIARIPIYPMAYYMGLGADNDTRDKAFAAAPVGTGPYQFQSFATGDNLVLKIFPTHSWRKPILTEITFRQMTDPSAQQAAFLSGEVQYINYMPISAVESLKASGAQLLTINTDASLGAFMDSINHDGTPKAGPMGDPRVRQALNYAIDKTQLAADVLSGQAQVQLGQIPFQDQFGFDGTLNPYTYDTAKAMSMLDDAGYQMKGDSRFTVTMATAVSPAGSIGRDMGEYVQDQLKQIGVKVDYTPLTDIGLAIDYFYGTKQRPDIYQFQLNMRPLLDPEAAYVWFRSDNPTKHMNNPDYDTAFTASQQELDPNKRADKIKVLSGILNKDVPYIFLTGAVSIEAAAAKLMGVIPNPAEFDQYYDTLYFVA
jgi:peptide/nickel transport system substrate-binding protein